MYVCVCVCGGWRDVCRSLVFASPSPLPPPRSTFLPLRFHLPPCGHTSGSAARAASNGPLRCEGGRGEGWVQARAAESSARAGRAPPKRPHRAVDGSLPRFRPRSPPTATRVAAATRARPNPFVLHPTLHRSRPPAFPAHLHCGLTSTHVTAAARPAAARDSPIAPLPAYSSATTAPGGTAAAMAASADCIAPKLAWPGRRVWMGGQGRAVGRRGGWGWGVRVGQGAEGGKGAGAAAGERWWRKAWQPGAGRARLPQLAPREEASPAPHGPQGRRGTSAWPRRSCAHRPPGRAHPPRASPRSPLPARLHKAPRPHGRGRSPKLLPADVRPRGAQPLGAKDRVAAACVEVQPHGMEQRWPARPRPGLLAFARRPLPPRQAAAAAAAPAAAAAAAPAAPAAAAAPATAAAAQPQHRAGRKRGRRKRRGRRRAVALAAVAGSAAAAAAAAAARPRRTPQGVGQRQAGGCEGIPGIGRIHHQHQLGDGGRGGGGAGGALRPGQAPLQPPA
jgi:hypothetical protein